MSNLEIKDFLAMMAAAEHSKRSPQREVLSSSFVIPSGIPPLALSSSMDYYETESSDDSSSFSPPPSLNAFHVFRRESLIPPPTYQPTAAASSRAPTTNALQDAFEFAFTVTDMSQDFERRADDNKERKESDCRDLVDHQDKQLDSLPRRRSDSSHDYASWGAMQAASHCQSAPATPATARPALQERTNIKASTTLSSPSLTTKAYLSPQSATKKHWASAPSSSNDHVFQRVTYDAQSMGSMEGRNVPHTPPLPCSKPGPVAILSGAVPRRPKHSSGRRSSAAPCIRQPSPLQNSATFQVPREDSSDEEEELQPIEEKETDCVDDVDNDDPDTFGEFRIYRSTRSALGSPYTSYHKEVTSSASSPCLVSASSQPARQALTCAVPRRVLSMSTRLAAFETATAHFAADHSTVRRSSYVDARPSEHQVTSWEELLERQQRRGSYNDLSSLSSNKVTLPNPAPFYVVWYRPNGIAPRHWSLFAAPDEDEKTKGIAFQLRGDGMGMGNFYYEERSVVLGGPTGSQAYQGRLRLGDLTTEGLDWLRMIVTCVKDAVVKHNFAGKSPAKNCQSWTNEIVHSLMTNNALLDSGGNHMKIDSFGIMAQVPL